MAGKATKKWAKRARLALISARDSAAAKARRPERPERKVLPGPEHGRQIYIFQHLQKNHIIYSLTKVLRNNLALNQIPFNGKKTVPSALRKDLWHPFATITFPAGAERIGLSVFQKLREYRKRHETEWDVEDMKDEKGNLLHKRHRGRVLCDQKANSVADMAAVLSRLDVKKDENSEREKGDVAIGLVGEGTEQKVEVRWRELADAQFAETWGENIEHAPLEMDAKAWYKAYETEQKMEQMLVDKRRLLGELEKQEAKRLEAERVEAEKKAATAKA